MKKKLQTEQLSSKLKQEELTLGEMQIIIHLSIKVVDKKIIMHSRSFS